MEFSLRPIGVVHSSVASTNDMPGNGVPATVEVRAEYAAGLEDITDNSHVTVVGWMHAADRDHLGATPSGAGQPRGVFGTRSPSRPNPLGISTARVVKVEGNTLHLAALDFVDGTPVVDIKCPARGWDFAWSAICFRDVLMATDDNQSRTLSMLLREAENFHGSVDAELALGVRMVFHAMRTWQVSPRDEGLKAIVGVDGCVADAVQALTGATLGNGRLRPSTATAFHFQRGDRQMTYFLHDLADRSAEDVMAATESALFSASEGPTKQDDDEPAALAAPLTGARREETLAAVQSSLVNGKLACAVAYKLSRQLNVGLRQIGQLANDEGIRISQCQLGCFR